jgi:ubiquinol-cytochrome c reductase iron-sulfur subunit
MTDNKPDFDRRKFLVAATTGVGVAGVAVTAVPFVKSMLPSQAAVGAAAPVEVNLNGIAPGAMTSLAWRGKPVFIVNRTRQMLATLDKHDSLLRDPRSQESEQPPYCGNVYRSLKPEWFVVVGICTHLGCVPVYRPEMGAPDLGSDWPGGFFCPCHGSKYDLSARVFQGVPAPLNMAVPRYQYLSDTRLLVGEDRTGT